ncbi:5-formyltetrahydrofolate cyclo-ligase [Palleronia caenipelagi]|uniref:5-formyltetrahydrofolate cyclo-ligase n=1 Tax=Palleronia caenipelagi TaxID=2489174 RepID=A0A547QB45_9RHOB|nr:5-formyltetrahydrofolate cyclo-ligase [Palleronia caenipelagi]TRD23602.1 5-formyltetrahydrofolate cyclo-ligase [Palleronia caenipelagi]
MSDIAAVKAAARKAAFARRAEDHRRLGAVVAPALTRLAEALDGAGGPVAVYWPIRTEIDPRPVLKDLSTQTCLPVVPGPDQPLRFRTWSDGDAIEPASFGVPVPATGDWLRPRTLIVPLLAFDRRGYRLGYGGGFYDRTIAELSGLHPLRCIGFAYDAQEVEAVPVEATDLPLDLIVTPTRTIRVG